MQNSKKVYRAILNQTETNAPFATVLENTFGETLIWDYQNNGTYGLRSQKKQFNPSRMSMIAQNNMGDPFEFYQCVCTDNEYVYLSTYANSVYTNGYLANTFFEVVVYP
jgi:hypothetical protein